MIRAFAILVSFFASTSLADPIVVPFEEGYLPFSALADNGEPDGFNIAVAREIAARMGDDLTLEGTDFDTIQFGAWPESWSFSVASMSRSAAREEHFAFIGPYYFDQVAVVTSKALGLGFDRDGFAGHKFGVCQGCIYGLYLIGTDSLYIDGVQSAAPFGQVTVTTFSSDFAVLRALGEDETPDIDYGVTSVFHALYYEGLGFPINHDERPLFVEPLWIVVPLERDDHIVAVKAAFDSLRDSGRLAELSILYLGDDFTTLPESK